MMLHLKGSEFEGIVQGRLDKYREAGLASISRYGVQAVRSRDQWHVIQSKPDYEGLVMSGPQVIFDCKVCSQASFPLDEYRNDVKAPKRRQLNHMIERARYGAKCFFLLHWNPRDLATKKDQAITYAFWVSSEIGFWERFFAGEIKRITREDCQAYGSVVPWTLFGPRDRVQQPDILAVL
jgi:penicillin-binding protein-related factor A (putative recombinase)